MYFYCVWACLLFLCSHKKKTLLIVTRKLQATAIQQDQEKHAFGMSHYFLPICLYIKLELIEKMQYGYFLHGKPMRNHRLLMRGEWISVITCISTRGLLDVKIVYGTTDGDGFYEFIYICTCCSISNLTMVKILIRWSYWTTVLSSLKWIYWSNQWRWIISNIPSSIFPS